MAAVDSGNQLIATVVNAIVTLVGWTIKIMLLIILGMIIRGVWSALVSSKLGTEGGRELTTVSRRVAELPLRGLRWRYGLGGISVVARIFATG